MKLTSLLLTVGLASALAVNSAQANLLISHNFLGLPNGFALSLFSDTGTVLQTYASGFGNGQRVAVDNVGNGYFADASTGVYKYNLTTAAGGLLFSQTGYTAIGVGFNSTRPGEILLAGADTSTANNSIARINSHQWGSSGSLYGRRGLHGCGVSS